MEAIDTALRTNQIGWQYYAKPQPESHLSKRHKTKAPPTVREALLQ
jgi:hypothetical protein